MVYYKTMFNNLHTHSSRMGRMPHILSSKRYNEKAQESGPARTKRTTVPNTVHKPPLPVQLS